MTEALKLCFKCGAEKPRTEFYKHKTMADGLLGKCKVCTKSDARKNREINLEYNRHYDRNRPNATERIVAQSEAKRQRCEFDPDFKARVLQQKSNWKIRNKDKLKAQHAVSNAIRSGVLQRATFCEKCNSDTNIEAHHWSYLEVNWLNVIWLCTSCHGVEHKRINQCIRNGEEPYAGY